MIISYNKKADYLLPNLILKEKNQMIWVSKMNNIKNIAEEIILKEYIYVWYYWWRIWKNILTCRY